MAEQFNWPPLESSPEIFADFAGKLGVEVFTVNEVFSFDEEMLAFLPQPTVGAIACVRRLDEKKAEDLARGDLGTEVGFYMDQTERLDNACGVIALIHAVLNNDGIPLREGSPLAAFKAENAAATPAERATNLDNFAAIHALYKLTAAEGDTDESGVHELGKGENAGKKTFHYIAYIRNSRGQLIELDGTKAGPWVVAEGVPEEGLMSAVSKEISRRQADGEIDQDFMAAMAIGPAP